MTSLNHHDRLTWLVRLIYLWADEREGIGDHG